MECIFGEHNCIDCFNKEIKNWFYSTSEEYWPLLQNIGSPPWCTFMHRGTVTKLFLIQPQFVIVKLKLSGHLFRFIDAITCCIIILIPLSWLYRSQSESTAYFDPNPNQEGSTKSNKDEYGISSLKFLLSCKVNALDIRKEYGFIVFWGFISYPKPDFFLYSGNILAIVADYFPHI